MVQSAFLSAEDAHPAATTDVMTVKRSYQRSGFAHETKIKGFFCRYATTGNSYWRRAYGIGESQGLAANEGDSIEPTGRAVPTKGGVRAGPTEVFLEARETTLLVEHKADEDPRRHLAG